MGSYSVALGIRCLMGQPLYCLAASVGVHGERSYCDGSNPYAWLSSIALLPRLPDLPSQAFPTTISSLMSTRLVSQQSVSSSPLLGMAPQSLCSGSLLLQLLGDLHPYIYDCGKDSLICITFRLSLHSQLQMFLLWLRQLPQCGDQTPASVPPPTDGRSCPTNTPVLPPSSFILPSFSWFYIFFSSGQVLLATLNCCFASTSVSLFLMYLWREMYSMSTYYSAILFLLWMFFRTSLLGNWDEDWHFPVLWPLLGLQDLLTLLVLETSHFLISKYIKKLHHAKCWAGWLINWNQDYQDKNLS